MEMIMSREEKNRLEQLERIVDEGKKTFVSVGSALKELRDGKMYRVSHKTFELYCEERFGFKRMQAHRLIEAADVVENVSHGIQIQNERQAREVAKAPPEMQQAVVEKATEMSEKTGKPVTAKTVAEARKAVMTPSEPDEGQYEDVDDEPDTVEAKSVTKPEPTKAEQASKLKSMIKQHNAAMIRLVDDLLVVSPNRKCHERVLVNFREIDAAVGAWK